MAVEFFARQPACQQNIHAVDPDVAPIQRADEICFLAAGLWIPMRAFGNDLMWTYATEKNPSSSLDFRMRRDFQHRRPHLAPFILPADLDDLSLL